MMHQIIFSFDCALSPVLLLLLGSILTRSRGTNRLHHQGCPMEFNVNWFAVPLLLYLFFGAVSK